ncbi:MAG: hypothetical protein AAF266_12950, partial [Planctomycetota bacterium]
RLAISRNSSPSTTTPSLATGTTFTTQDIAFTSGALVFANPGDTFNFQAFESFNDSPGPDATHNDLVVSLDNPFVVTDLGEFGAESPLEFDTNGSTFDTELAIYTDTGQLIANDDDGGFGTQSRLLENLTSGEYRLVVGGFNSDYGEGIALPGTSAGDFTLNLGGSEIATGALDGNEFAVFSFAVEALDGDYNNDGLVSAADYVVWRDGGSPDNSAAGYNTWAGAFGPSASPATAGASAVTVPEPGAGILFALCLLLLQPVHRAR